VKTIVQKSYGSTDVLKYDDSVWHLMSGLPYLIRILGYGFTGSKQIIPGLDVAGIVRKVGDNVPVP